MSRTLSTRVEARPVSPESCPASPDSRSESPVRTARARRRVSHPHPPSVPGTHSMTVCPSTTPQRVPLPSSPASSLPHGPDPESDSLLAASPTVMHFLATAITDPLFESTPVSALVAELVDFAAACRLDYATSLVAESEVKQPPGSPPLFKARYVARGISQRQGVDFFQTFSPTPKMTTLRVLLHVATQRDYELHSLDFSTAFLYLRRPVYGLRQAPREWHDTVLVYVDNLVFATTDTEALAHVNSELQKRHTCTDLGELTSYLGVRITRDRAQHTITLTQSHMVQQVLQRFSFTYSSQQSTPLPTGHLLSAPPSDESVEPSGPYPELVGCLITSGTGLVLGGRARVVLTGHADAYWVDDLATQQSSSCEAEIYAGAMAAQELRWLTYLLTDLGEAPRSPPVLYVDNKAMLALCQEHRLEH
ncbi:unnamed protein product [Closterium sp. NIES-53]